MAPITVWVLSRGQQHEGGNVISIWAAESAANTEFINKADELRKYCVDLYNRTKQRCMLEEFLQERTEIKGNDYKTYYCGADYIHLEQWVVL